MSDRVGKVSILSTVPSAAKAVLVLAHGAGADMCHSFMASLASELVNKEVGVVRFNFPYMEKAKRGRPDPPGIAEKTVQVIIEYTHSTFPSIPIFVGGKSFGGRMASQHLSKTPDSPVQGIIFYGFPLHAPGRPSVDRGAHLSQVKVPMLFLQGTRDTLAEITLIKKVTKPLKRAKLILFENADHSFKVKGNVLIPDLAEATNAWISKQTS